MKKAKKRNERGTSEARERDECAAFSFNSARPYLDEPIESKKLAGYESTRPGELT